MAEENCKPKEFKPYVPANQTMPEFTPKAVLLGALFGIIFGAATVYLGLKVGLTVSASIPIAVLSIAVFKKIGKSTILENNIVQTVGSAGESVAGGVVFTMPALLFLAGGMEYFKYFQVYVLALAGGILGVLFMIPLRRTLIVKEHGNLPYPEGLACGDVLIAGEKGGNLAKKVFSGLFAAFAYKALMSIMGVWKEVPAYMFGRKSALPNGKIEAEISPELLGVGYIIGPKVAGIMVAGGILSYLVLIPLITTIGDLVTVPILPALIPIGEMSHGEIRGTYIRYIGAGAVTFGGIVTLVKSLPTIIGAFKDSLADMRKGAGARAEVARTERDLPMSFVIVGSLLLVAFMTLVPQIPTNFLSAILIVAFGFFFVTVSSRITGLIGSSSNPISGMTIATLMATCLIFVGIGWTGDVYQPIALAVGSIICIAAANAGNTSQDLKTGFIVGATPKYQQYGLLIGVAISSVFVGGTLLLLNKTMGIGIITPEHPNPLAAPQATLMATIIKGILSKDLPWALVMIGMAISAVLELSGVRSLPFAVGVYLPLSTSTPIFVGGMLRHFSDKIRCKKGLDTGDSETGPGALFSSGLIAGGALTGVLTAILISIKMGTNADGSVISLVDKLHIGFAAKLGAMGDLISIGFFAVLSIMLFRFATAKNN